jgi:hypothetical protein
MASLQLTSTFSCQLTKCGDKGRKSKKALFRIIDRNGRASVYAMKAVNCAVSALSNYNTKYADFSQNI